MRPQHWALLAATRFILASVVVAGHSRFALTDSVARAASSAAMALGGGVAVIGFLVISGFSIAHSVQQPRGFYARRFARIWPTLLLSVVLFAGLIWTFHRPGRPDPGLLEVLGVLAFLNGLVFANWYGPTWSLSIEVLFYALAPALRRLPVAALAGLVAVSAAAHWQASAWLGVASYPDALHGRAPLGLFWAWGLGFLVFRERRKAVAGPFWGLVLWLGGGLLIWRFNPEGGGLWAATWTLAALVVGFGGVVRFGSDALRRALNYLGDLSYPMFLLHMPIFFLMGRLGLRQGLVGAIAVLAASALCLHLVDRPLRAHVALALERAGARLRRRFRPGRSPAASSDAS